MNFFGKRRQQNPNQRVPEERQLTQAELHAAIMLFERNLRAKGLETWFNQRCVKSCCKLDNDLIDDTEANCLDNCFAKYGKYLQINKNFNTENAKKN